jgi:hypothetical protein
MVSAVLTASQNKQQKTVNISYVWCYMTVLRSESISNKLRVTHEFSKLNDLGKFIMTLLSVKQLQPKLESVEGAGKLRT